LADAYNRRTATAGRYAFESAYPSRPRVSPKTEKRVAELVAKGLTNREVAAQLFLSVSTIESNLRRAYRKLGVRSRTELANKLSASSASEA
jgi:DNA-binding NarL/FixJ family response regulator